MNDGLDVAEGSGHGPRVDTVDIRSHGEAAQRANDLEQEILARWSEALRTRPSLVDGEILSVTGWSVDDGALRVDVAVERYRRFMAQRSGLPLGLTALAVSGVVRLSTGELVLGRRSAQVTQYPGAWELMPSGGVSARHVRADNTVDTEAQLLEEFEEELGLPRSAVRRTAPLCIIEDLADRVIDIGYLLDIELDRTTFQPPRSEYDDIELQPLHEMARWASEQTVVPTVAPLVRALQERDAAERGRRS